MPQTHILRRSPRTLREMHTEATQSLAEFAPVTGEPAEDDPKWLRNVDPLIRAILDKHRLLRGYSDRQRYGKMYRQDTIDALHKLLAEELEKTMDAFRTGVGHKPDFDLRAYLEQARRR